MHLSAVAPHQAHRCVSSRHDDTFFIILTGDAEERPMNHRSACIVDPHRVDPHGLQEVFRDLIRLAVVGDHVRWVVIGEGSAELAKWLRETVPQWRDWAEELAGYMTKLEIAPDGRVKTLARDVTRQWVPAGWLTTADARNLMAPRVDELIKWVQVQRSMTTGGDDRNYLAEIESGLAAQLRELVQVGHQP
jgi:hypothetical protein